MPNRPDAAADAHYRELFDAIDQGFCIIEVLFDSHDTPVDYRFLETNAAFEAQTGLRDAPGRRIRELAPSHEEHWFRIYGDVARTGTPHRFQQEAAALGRWYDVYAFRIDEPERRRVAILFQDITDRRRADLAVRASEDALRQSEAEHAAARRQAEEANRAKDRFLAMVGHELRNPLAAMLTALQVMRLRGRHSPEQDVLERQVKHLSRMADDLLDASRISRGMVELRREPVELCTVVVSAMELAGPLLEQQQDHVHIDVPRQGLVASVDRDRMAQVVANLLTNAAKYSNRGSRITIRGTRREDRVQLRVEDEGFGLPQDVLKTIFEPFAQQPQATEFSQGGLGLGLAIVRRLVEAHGGTVRAESAGVGRGSQFIIELPAPDGTDGPTQARVISRDGN
jgi:signal transduction histidine kinase